LESALQLLGEAEEKYFRSPVPINRPVAALRALLWLRQERLKEVGDWLQQIIPTIGDDPNFLTEFTHLIRSRYLIARFKHLGEEAVAHEAEELLNRLHRAAGTGRRYFSVIEIRLQQAILLDAQGEQSAALTALQAALSPAEPEGFIRLIADEGPGLAPLLETALEQNIYTDYVKQLLAACKTGTAPGSATAATHSSLVEALSDRELEILRLISMGLSNSEICGQLYISLSTVKGHNRNIFGKLGAQNRTEAVARARELGLI